MKLTKITLFGLVTAFGLAVPTLANAQNKAGADKADKGDAMFKAMDTNGDGKISADEHAAGAKKMFDKMDANHDGKVTAEEMTAAHEAITGQKAAAGEPSSADKIKQFDTNGDGALSQEEYLAGSKAMFDKLDTNHDGYLSKEEVEAGHKAMMKPAPQK